MILMQTMDDQTTSSVNGDQENEKKSQRVKQYPVLCAVKISERMDDQLPKGQRRANLVRELLDEYLNPSGKKPSGSGVESGKVTEMTRISSGFYKMFLALKDVIAKLPKDDPVRVAYKEQFKILQERGIIQLIDQYTEEMES